jgi:peroxiredoxin Q/BCP
MLEKGQSAPDFALPDDTGRTVRLSDFKGKKVVVYFYPKDDTPGCTREACSFRDTYNKLLDKGAVVIGISADTPESHAGFKKKYNLPFYLLSDRDKAVIREYGAWGRKKLYGKEYEGILRSTFIVNEQGLIDTVFPDVRPDEHGQEVLAALA